MSGEQVQLVCALEECSYSVTALWKDAGALRIDLGLLGEEIEQIATPILVIDPDDEQFFPARTSTGWRRI